MATKTNWIAVASAMCMLATTHCGVDTPLTPPGDDAATGSPDSSDDGLMDVLPNPHASPEAGNDGGPSHDATGGDASASGEADSPTCDPAVPPRGHGMGARSKTVPRRRAGTSGRSLPVPWRGHGILIGSQPAPPHRHGSDSRSAPVPR
jgi:hypothetical protein